MQISATLTPENLAQVRLILQGEWNQYISLIDRKPYPIILLDVQPSHVNTTHQEITLTVIDWAHVLSTELQTLINQAVSDIQKMSTSEPQEKIGV